MSSLFARYYAAAAAGDGAVACSLLTTPIARAAVETYGQGLGPAFLRGSKTCPEVLSRVFRHSHEELAGTARVTAVRIERGHALAFLDSATLRYVYTRARREAGAWRVIPFLGAQLP
ncbi:MAG TPA: hypothetical protein VFW38_11465 [Solirubrobacteraceae bacterium]|nr:hypothetical protein [Solirubrobacteraceae bacterium]